jgi:hypothetical protein
MISDHPSALSGAPPPCLHAASTAALGGTARASSGLFGIQGAAAARGVPPGAGGPAGT